MGIMTPLDPPPAPEPSARLRSQSVTVAVEAHGQAVVLVVAGEIDLLTAPQFQEALTRALEDRPETLVVDLSKVEFMGSAGLAALVDRKSVV